MKFFTYFLLILTTTFADESLDTFIKSNNIFTSSIYKKISKNENYNSKNLIVSPFSAEVVLSLAQFGARGPTAEELDGLLRLRDNTIYKTVLTKLQQNESSILQAANKIYIKDNFAIKEEFKDIATRIYLYNVENIDFTKNAQAAETINLWVEEQTRNKIHGLINSDDINNRTKLISVNALYFKGAWLKPFSTDRTIKLDFHVTPEDTKKVETMRSRFGDEFLYYECSHLKAKFLEVLIKGGASMTFILPNDKNGLSKLEGHIDWVLTPHNLTYESVLVSLPKFKIESTIDLKEILTKWGVEKAFDAGEADFSGIAGDKGDLIIDKIVQKGFIEVDEGGVEAATSTFIGYPAPSSAIPEPKEFTADHPFLFYIKDNGIIIFVGRVLKPEL